MDVIRPIKCKECGKTMRPQVSEVEYVLYCDPCKRGVIVSDWNGDAEFLSK